MNITASHVDTCLSDYLRDSYSRPGQALCLSSLGCTLDETVDVLYESIDWDSGLPESIFDTDIKDAFRVALKGVDLRYIDEDGNRQEESDDEREWPEPYLYMVLEWDATKVKMVLNVDVEFFTCGVDPMELKLALEDVIRQAAGDGKLTAGDAEVISWGTGAYVKGEEPCRKIDYRDLISQIDWYHGNQMKDRDERSIEEEIATLKSIVEGE